MRAKPSTNMYKSSGRNMGLRPGKRYVRIFCRMNGVKCSATHRALRSSPYVRLVEHGCARNEPDLWSVYHWFSSETGSFVYFRTKEHAHTPRKRGHETINTKAVQMVGRPSAQSKSRKRPQGGRPRESAIMDACPGERQGDYMFQVRISSRVLVSPRICVFPHHIKH